MTQRSRGDGLRLQDLGRVALLAFVHPVGATNELDHLGVVEEAFEDRAGGGGVAELKGGRSRSNSSRAPVTAANATLPGAFASLPVGYGVTQGDSGRRTRTRDILTLIDGAASRPRS